MVYDTIGAEDVEWAGKTYKQVVELAERDGSVLVVPVGSLEQHGDHMPTITDSLLATAVAQGSAGAVADEMPVLVTPPVWTGYSPHHMAFGGTVTIQMEVLMDLLGDIASSALDNGFDALFLLNGHGGNIDITRVAVREIGGESSDVEIHGLTYFELAEPFIDDVRDSDPGGMGHAGEFETSLMLHLRPDLVDEEEFAAEYRDRPYQEPWGRGDMFGPLQGPLATYVPFDGESSTGVVGDATLATAEKGERIYEGIVENLSELLLEIHERNAE